MSDHPTRPSDPIDDAGFQRAWSHLGRRLLLPTVLGLLAFVFVEIVRHRQLEIADIAAVHVKGRVIEIGARQ